MTRLYFSASTLVFLLALSPHATSAQPYPVELISRTQVLVQGNDRSGNPTISPDGGFVAFTSFADNLVAGDTNRVQDVFLHDRATDAVERVSLAFDGSQANGPSSTPGIGGYLVTRLGVSQTADVVAFASQASNLVRGDTNSLTDIFVRDRVAGTTERVSVSSSGEQASGFSGIWVALTADGQQVAFDSAASNLVDGDENFIDVFVRDRSSGVTELISRASNGEQANGMARRPDLSATGRFVVFESGASNLEPGDANGLFDIFVRDRQGGTTERISTAMGGGDADGESSGSAISADGRFVTFYSEAGNLVPGDTNMARDVFVHDRQTGTTERVSIAAGGAEGDLTSLSAGGELDISADGRMVTFASAATNLVAGDANADRDVFLHDRQTGETTRLSVAEDGTQGDGMSDEPTISDDGSVLAFGANATTLVAGDANKVRDVFAIERLRPLERYEYVAKVVCGIQEDPDALQLIRGAYASTVDIHNPHRETVAFFKKLALTIPPGFQEPGEILPIAEDTLAYDEALATDCEDLRTRLFPDGFPGGIIEGYVVIQSPRPLEVDVVYTTGSVDERGRVGSITSIDVERVRERDRAEGCDLELEKTAEVFDFPQNLPDNFDANLILYTVSMQNTCDAPAMGVSLLDELRTSAPGTVSILPLAAPVLVQPMGTLSVGAVAVEPDGTLSATVTGTIATLAPGETAEFQFWILTVAYQIGQPQVVDLINRAEITTDLFEESLANNAAEVVTPLF